MSSRLISWFIVNVLFDGGILPGIVIAGFFLKFVPLLFNSWAFDASWEQMLGFISFHGCSENENEGAGKHNKNNYPSNAGASTSITRSLFSVFPNDIGWFSSTSDLDVFS
jgi:hypothetical protein